jgi:hypothetical protein
MKKLAFILMFICSPAFAKTTHMVCMTDNNQVIETLGDNNNINIRWDNKEWGNAWAVYESPVLTVTQIGSSGVFRMSWNVLAGSTAYLKTVFSNGRVNQGTANCWFR